MTVKEKTIEALKSSQAIIQSDLKISDLQYSQFQYEVGLEFLERNYPPNQNPEYDKMRYKLEGSKFFWNWWKLQWHNHERKLMNCTQGVKYGSWKLYMGVLVDHNMVHASFNDTVLKHIYNGGK